MLTGIFKNITLISNKFKYWPKSHYYTIIIEVGKMVCKHEKVLFSSMDKNKHIFLMIPWSSSAISHIQCLPAAIPCATPHLTLFGAKAQGFHFTMEMGQEPCAYCQRRREEVDEMMTLWHITKLLMQLELKIASFAWIFLGSNWFLGTHSAKTRERRKEQRNKIKIQRELIFIISDE